MPSTPTLPRDIHSIALDAVVSRMQDSEQQRRRVEAEQVTLFAEALDQVSPDHFTRTRLGSSGRGVAGTNADAQAEARPAATPHSPSEILYRSLRAELACALGLSERSIDRRLTHAYDLTRNYCGTYHTLLDGQIGLAHTEIITSAGTIIGLGDDPSTITRRVSYERAVLAHAVRETPARLRPIARRLAERFSEHTIDERHAQAKLERRVWVVNHEDGMSDLTARLPSVQAHAIHDRLTRASKLLRSAALDNGRTQDELRTDVFSELLLATPGCDRHGNGATGKSTGACVGGGGGGEVSTGAGAGSGSDTGTGAGTGMGTSADNGDLGSDPAAPVYANIQAQIQVIVTDETLFATHRGIPDDGLDWGAPSSLYPAELIGSGPIDTESVRTLAAATSHWELVRTHPDTGAVTSVEKYRPSEQIRRILRARDLHCRFPGCRAPAHRCDLDHTIDAAMGGPTSTDNLAHLCRGHHTLKHHGGWGVSQHAGGVLHWRSPTGRNYTDRPPSRARFTTVPTSVESYRLDPADHDRRQASNRGQTSDESQASDKQGTSAPF